MPNLIFSVVTYVAAAVIGMLSSPFLHEYGLAPWSQTLPPPRAFHPMAANSEDYLRFCSNGTWSPFRDEMKILWAQKPSSTTAPHVETPPPVNSESAYSFLYWHFARVAYAFFTTEAVIFSRLTSFFRTSGPPTQANTSHVIIKDNQNDLMGETGLLKQQQCDRQHERQRSQYWASRHDRPQSNYVDKGIQTAPMPSPQDQSLQMQPRLRPEAATFKPQVPLATTPMSREQLEQFQSQFPMHGRRAL